jgi:MFS family permease
MEATLLAWLVLDMTDSPWQVAVVGFFGWAPLLLLGLIGGALADSLDRRRLYRTVLAVNLATALALAAVLAGDLVQVWHAFLAMFVSGSAYALGMPSRRTLIHDIVGRSRVTNAVALDNLARNASGVIGPSLAGALITWGSVTAGYAAIAVFYVASLILLWKLHAPTRERSRLSGALIAGNLVLGLKYVSGHRTLLATVLIAFVMNLFVTPYRQMVPVVARDTLRVPPGLMGILMSAHEFGSLAGSFLVASAGTIRYHGRVYIAGSMLTMIAVLVFSLSRSYALSLLIASVAGLGNAGFNTMQMSLTMLLPKDEMRGAALGAMSLGIGGGPIGMLITGGVASAIGTTDAIGLNAIVGVTALAIIALVVPSLRQPIIAEELP